MLCVAVLGAARDVGLRQVDALCQVFPLETLFVLSVDELEVIRPVAVLELEEHLVGHLLTRDVIARVEVQISDGVDALQVPPVSSPIAA